MGFEVILPFLRPIEALIQDPAISEIMVNGSTRVFIERCGIVEEVSGVTIPEKSLQVAIRNIARALGDEINEEKPLLDSRLPDGSRVAAVIPPCSGERHHVDHSQIPVPILHTPRARPYRYSHASGS